MRFYAAEVLLALQYLHLLGFVYRWVLRCVCVCACAVCVLGARTQECVHAQWRQGGVRVSGALVRMGVQVVGGARLGPLPLDSACCPAEG